MKIRNFRNLSLKKALIRNNFPKSKSVNLRNKSINENKNKSIIEQKNKRNLKNSYIIKDNKDYSKFDSLDLDLDSKNENDIAEKIYKAN